VTGTEPGDSPVEEYLDELVSSLSVRRPRQLRHLLAETEAHLRDDADDLVSQGHPVERAEALAVARFGPARDLVKSDDNRLPLPVSAVFRQTVSTGLLLAGIGALAVGLSGIIAAVVRAVAGSRALVDVVPGQVFAPAAADCARWLANDPGAGSCRNAAVADWADETVFYRIAIGLLGVVCLLAYSWLRRRGWSVLPSAVSNTVALTLFAAAGVSTLAMGTDAIVVSAGNGSGQWLSAAAVALVAAAVFGWRVLRDLRTQAV
jgi:hypothetical protein